MTPAVLIRHIESRGVRLSAQDGKLQVRAPEGVLTPDLKVALAGLKPGIMLILAALGDRPRKPSGAPHDDEIAPEGSPYGNRTLGQIRVQVANAAMKTGLSHVGLRMLTVRVTGRGSLWALGPRDLLRIEDAIHELVHEKGGSPNG